MQSRNSKAGDGTKRSRNESNRRRNFWVKEIFEFEALKRFTENKWNTCLGIAMQNSWIYKTTQVFDKNWGWGF